MTSKAKKLEKSDFKRWGTTIGIALLATLVDVVAVSIIPELKESGTANGILIIVLAVFVDLGRRFVKDTRVIDQEDYQKLLIKEKK